MNGHNLARLVVGFAELSSLIEAWLPIFVAAIVGMALLAVVVAHFARRSPPGR